MKRNTSVIKSCIIYLCAITISFSAFSKNNTIGEISLSAGNDISIVLPTNSSQFNANASSTAGAITSYNWVKIAGPVSYAINNSNISNPLLTGLTEGTYAFELTVSDIAANTAKDTILITVSTRVLIDFGPATNTSPDVNGNYWNNVYMASNGNMVSNAITTTNIRSGLGLEVVNRIDGTFGIQNTGLSSGNTIGAVGDYSSNVTSDYAFADLSASNGSWKLTGLESNKKYTIKFWGTKSVLVFPNIIEIRKTGDATWQSYNATSNNNFNNAATFEVTGVTEASFDIRVQSGSSFGYICLMDIYRTSTDASINSAPIAFAGNDIYLTTPATSTSVNGSLSSDVDGNISTYLWRKISGPNSYTINTPNSSTTTISDLADGIYTFELAVTDNEGGIDADTVLIFIGKRVLIDFGASITSSPDINGNYWNNVTTGTPGIKLANAINSSNVTTGIRLNIENRIDGTFNLAGPGVNSTNYGVGSVSDYTDSAIVDYAFSDPSSTNGRWRIEGLDSNGTYAVKFWGTRITTNSSRKIEIKTSSDTEWKMYDASNNIDYDNGAYFIFTGKTLMDFDIRVPEYSFFGYINLLDIHYINACRPSFSNATANACGSYLWNDSTYTISGLHTFTTANINGCDSVAILDLVINQTPTVNAGGNQTIVEGTSASIAASVTGNPNFIQWTGGTGTFLPSDTSLIVTYTPSAAEVAAGSVILTLTADGGACGTVQNTITIVITNPVPVHLIRFAGFNNGKVNILNWTTASESNNKGFELQRSYDGKKFTTIQFIATQALAGNSNMPLHYQFTDDQFVGQLQYYRLVQIDNNNHQRISQIVTIKFDKQHILVANVYPNPTHDVVYVNIAAPIDMTTYLIVTDNAGRFVSKQLLSLKIGNNTLKLQTDYLAAGTYQMTLVSDQQQPITTKFVKE